MSFPRIPLARLNRAIHQELGTVPDVAWIKGSAIPRHEPTLTSLQAMSNPAPALV